MAGLPADVAGRVRALVTVEVPDDDTPELVCTGCGSAVISAPLTGLVWWRPKGARIAPQQRRAA